MSPGLSVAFQGLHGEALPCRECPGGRGVHVLGDSCGGRVPAVA